MPGSKLNQVKRASDMINVTACCTAVHGVRTTDGVFPDIWYKDCGMHQIQRNITNKLIYKDKRETSG